MKGLLLLGTCMALITLSSSSQEEKQVASLLKRLLQLDDPRLDTRGSPKKPDPCAGSPVILTGTTAGILDYPFGNVEYGNSQTCHWLIRAPGPYYTVKVTVYFMDIEDDNPCDDFMQLWEAQYMAATDKEYKRKALSPQMCVDDVDQLPQKVYVAQSPEVYVYFKSDWRTGDDGFTILYEFIPTAQVNTPRPYNGLNF